MGVDISSVGLEIDSGGMLSGVERIDAALRRLEQAIDRTVNATTRGSRANREAGASTSQQAKEAIQLAIAQARVQRSMADYTGAVETLRGALKNASATSVEYLRIQNQIIQIQNQARRASVGANFEGFAASLKGIQGQLGNLTGSFGTVVTRIQNASSAVQEFTGLSSGGTALLSGFAIGIAAIGIGAGVAAKKIFDLSVEGAKLADSLNDMSRITGISVEELSAIKTAAALGGSSLDEFQAAATIFASKLEQVSQGKLPQLAGALKAFGIDAKKGLEEPEKAVIAFGNGISSIEDPILRASVAKEGLGRAGAKLIPLFDNLNDKTGEFAQALARSGGVSTEVARAAGALDDKLAGLRDQADNARIKLAAITAGPITIGIDNMARSFSNVGFALDTIGRSPGVGALLKIAGSSAGLAIILGSITENITNPNPAGVFGQIAVDTIRGRAGTPTAARTNTGSVSLSDVLGTGSSTTTQSVSARVREQQRLAEEEARRVKPPGGIRPRRTAQEQEAKPFEFRDIQGLTVMIQALRDAVVAAGKFGQQSLPELEKSIAEITGGIDTLTKELAVLPPTSREAASVAQQLNKAHTELTVALRKQFELLQSTRLPTRFPGQLNTDDILKLLPKQAIPNGVQAGSTKFEDFFAPNERRRPGELLGIREKFFGREDTQTGERVRGVGELIAQDFITGALLGQADAKRAGESVAYFFADYAARKIADVLSKELDKAFDFLGGLIAGLFKKIFSKVSGGFGGLLGNVFGGFFADGGTLQPGKFGIAGENGRELIFSGNQPLQVMPLQKMAGAGGGGGTIQVTNYFSIASQTGQVDRRSLDQIAEASTFAMSRALRNRGA